MGSQHTFVTIAPDCPLERAERPPPRQPPSRAEIEWALLSAAPYAHTHESLSHAVHLAMAAARGTVAEDFAGFHRKGRACIRSSPLTKRYGWGVHYDAEGRMALVPAGSPAYAAMLADPTLRKEAALRSRRG